MERIWIPSVADSATESSVAALDAEFVDAWLAKRACQAQPAQQCRLLEPAVLALCETAADVLGELTVETIVARVLSIAGQRSSKTVSGVDRATRLPGVAQIRDWIADSPASERPQRLRLLLVELLINLGGLTDELCTPALHARITQVEPDPLLSGSERGPVSPQCSHA